ncbi:CU044_2847 family protein [Micromonospora cathayae]|uniref:CU044_2847 family protein n=1 Tax=Micromonospora cathayae TaxID=3028804 RepID=A0ABY7ZYY2_9ACTN|nr:CU044_2847 family protein [Micromonospora sp. HUAS 3]WDZ87104.1 CU044_2847 family protein [Micromonospora sp. HUAS 3]
MTDVVEFALDGGGTVLVAVDTPPGITPATSADGLVRKVGVSFDRAIGQVRDAASAALGQFRSMADRPDEVEISFGVQLTAEAGAVIARTGVQGQLQVTVRWNRSGETTA